MSPIPRVSDSGVPSGSGTWSFPRPCSRRSSAIRCACSLVLSRLMLKATRNFRAPVTVAPQLGTKVLGPKSGAHSACLSCGETQPGKGPLEAQDKMGETPPGSAPSPGEPHTARPVWPAESGDWPSALLPRRGTLQGRDGQLGQGRLVPLTSAETRGLSNWPQEAL